MSKNVKRLFNDFKPSLYEIELNPNKENMTFTGSVKITGKKIGRPSKRLTFHQKDLKINSVSLLRKSKKSSQLMDISRINSHSGFDEVRIHTTENVYPDEYEIDIKFGGKITKNMNGIYPCEFKNKGEVKQLIATQFESHHAREVFPCIDEPEAKAEFKLTLNTPKEDIVVSNTPLESENIIKDTKTSIFEKTPIMSTYLLAFVYGDMKVKEAETKTGIKVRAYATPDNIDFTDFSLEVAVKCLEYYEDYFGIKYPLEKCDMIALPDFASGAMENWGCITYREQCMLVDPKNTSLATKQYVAMVVAHELAHQWFGNLVTMRWWTDLWLNEGFASWIEYMAIDNLFPEWQMWTQFTVDEQQRAFKLDALEFTHPIEVPIKHPDEIRTIFDTISYSKGASVIHMLNGYLGDKLFRKGLSHYLNIHAYKNTDTVDLWQALEDVSKKPVKEFMHAWTSYDGFPVIDIDTTNNNCKLTQSRFFINPKHGKHSNKIWPIALESSDKTFPEMFNAKEINIKTTNKKIKLNQLQTGFYRVNYSHEVLSSLGSKVSNHKLSPQDRLGLLSDVFEVSKAGYTPATNALDFLSYYKNEDNNAVWDVIAVSLGSLRQIMDDENLRDSIKPFVIDMTSKQLKRLGWKPKKNDSYFDLLLRPTVLALSSSADNKETVNHAIDVFNDSKTIKDIAPDFRSLILSTAVRVNNDKKTFNKILKMYKQSNLSEERTLIASALTGFKDNNLIHQAIDLIKTDEVRHQDIAYWVVYSFSNRYAKRIAWKWLKDNWKWLEKNIGSDLSFYRFPLYAANVFSDESFIEEYNDFFEPLKSSALERSINQGLETLQWQSSWKENNLDQIKEWFNKKYPS